MRIGLYGMPTAGKTYIQERIDFLEVFFGSQMLRQFDPDFDKQSEEVKEFDRRAMAKSMMNKRDFIMDGHYAFGEKTVFTEEDGELYDVFLYLYINPEVLMSRMEKSSKNQRYLDYDIKKWQNMEIKELRTYCHQNNKDFYIIDNPPENGNEDISVFLAFIRAIQEGYSCISFARQITDWILFSSDKATVTLVDGDKTLTIEDTSNRVLGYVTNLYDGNFYTGYQAWKQAIEFKNYECPDLYELPVQINDKVRNALRSPAYILTSGHQKIWEYISEQLNLSAFYGERMSADTKFFVAKFLQEAGRKVIAYGDGMNDYYMLRQADDGFLVTRSDGTVSRSLREKSLEGLKFV